MIYYVNEHDTTRTSKGNIVLVQLTKTHSVHSYDQPQGVCCMLYYASVTDNTFSCTVITTCSIIQTSNKRERTTPFHYIMHPVSTVGNLDAYYETGVCYISSNTCTHLCSIIHFSVVKKILTEEMRDLQSTTHTREELRHQYVKNLVFEGRYRRPSFEQPRRAMH